MADLPSAPPAASTAPANPVLLAGLTFADEAECERLVRTLLDDRQPFRAHDLARLGSERYPDSTRLRLLSALALMQTGAAREARRILDTMPGGAGLDEAPFRRMHEALKLSVSLLDGVADGPPSRDALAAVGQLSQALEDVRGKQLLALSSDRETLTLLARLHVESWRHSGDRGELERARALYLQDFDDHGGAGAGTQAAVLSHLLDDTNKAAALARAVIAREDDGAGDRFRQQADRALAHLLLGEAEAATACYRAALDGEGETYQKVVAARQQLLLLAEHGLGVPDDLLGVLKPPTVVVFTGPMLDRPAQEAPLFPPHIEHALRAEIDRRLDALQAQIGYSSAACGSELLFVEAMLERGAEVNIVLPFELEDFVASNVAFGGPRWERRFRNAIRLASSVSFATEERYLGHEMLFRFGNQVLHGLAMLRAGFLTTAPHLLAVWDLMSGSLPGGAADFIDQWGDITRLQIVDIDDLAAENPAPASAPTAAAAMAPPQPAFRADPPRTIKAMLFADLVGYSALKEQHVPAFLDFLRALEEKLKRSATAPDFVHTWGDALFVVMPQASQIADYALLLQESVEALGSEIDGLPKPLQIRISLHGGPVFAATDPFTGGSNCYGTHINRAARLEPVTMPGHVFSTEPFVAMLTAEQSEARNAAERGGEGYRERFLCDYVGILPLAKKFGHEPIYHLRRAR